MPDDAVVSSADPQALIADRPKRVSRGQIMPGFPMAAYKLIQEHDVVSIHSPMLKSCMISRAKFSSG